MFGIHSDIKKHLCNSYRKSMVKTDINSLIDETVEMSKFQEMDVDKKIETLHKYNEDDLYLFMHSHMAEFLKTVLETKDQKIQKAILERSKIFVTNVIAILSWIEDNHKI